MGMVGLSFWAFRSNMRAVRWGIVFLLVALHAYMKAPVWFLIARLGDAVGGGGWHRAALIDAAIRHFNEWWLIGTTYTAHWMPTTLAISPNSADLTNQFISEGVNGGTPFPVFVHLADRQVLQDDWRCSPLRIAAFKS